MSPDPFGRALRDHHCEERTEPLLQRDGPETLEHPIERFYFDTYAPNEDGWLESRLNGPLLDIGAGVGKHALYFQEQFETVAIEVSTHLIETMRDRGVTDARKADMFTLGESFSRDRFRSALAYGTQVGLAGSLQGVRQFLRDLAVVTTPDATAVIDSYDPDTDGVSDLLGYRDHPSPGLAHRVMCFEYEGNAGEILLFVLFSPDRLREATVGTGWEVTGIRDSGGPSSHYMAVLSKN